jgi:hypothetical protein
MKNEIALTPKQIAEARWAEAARETTDFYREHYGSWTPEVGTMYFQLRDRSDKLFYDWIAESSGKTTKEVAYSVNESINSRFD